MAAENPSGMAKAVDNLEQMFKKADNEINYLTRKMSFELDYGHDGTTQQQANPVRLMERVEEIKKQYSTVSQEIAEIQKTQKETVDFFRSQLLTMTEMLQRLETQTGTNPELSEADAEKFEELAQLIGLPRESFLPQIPPPSTSSSETEVAPAAAAAPSSSTANQRLATESVSSETSESPPTKDEELVPQISPYDCRADSSEFIPLTQDEFMSVSELIRLRAKLDDVNKTYKLLWQHFKEEGNKEPLTPREMNTKGMKVTGATGEAKLKILRALKLCQISKTGSVTLT